MPTVKTFPPIRPGSPPHEPANRPSGTGSPPLVKLEHAGSAGGGKGAGLARLVAAGLPVPPTRVLTTEALDRFLDHAGVPADRPVDQALAAIGTAPFPPGWESALIAAGRALGPRLAVRSSGAEEDGAVRSFAGVHHTALGVPPERVPEAVRAVWASAFGPVALAYRGQAGRIAVLLQPLLQPEAAGVVFTVNPQNGSWREVVVEAVRGQGEALVSGRQAPQGWVVRRPRILPGRRVWNRLALRVVDADPVPQEQTWAIGSNGELARRPVPPAQRACPLLDPPAVLALCRLALRAEAAAGGPLDVEWALVDRRLVLLQARPITATAAPRPRDVLWTRRFLGERWPEPPTPLSWSLLEPTLAWFIAYPEVQARYLGGGPALRLLRGRPYLNATVFRHLLFKLPGAPAPRFMLELLPPDEVDAWRASFRVRADWAVYHAIVLTTLRERRWERFAFDPFTNHQVWERLHARFEAELDALSRPVLGARDAVGRVEAQRALVRDYLSVHVCSLLFANLGYQLLEALLASWAPGSTARWMEALAVCPPGNRTLETNEALWALGRQAMPSDRAALSAQAPLSPAFAAALERFLAAYGHRAEASWEVFSPRWADAPERLAPLLEPPPPGRPSPAERARAQEARFTEARQALLDAVPGWRGRALDRALFLTRRYLLLRENQRFAFDRLQAALRRTLGELGAMLPLEQPEDVRWLTWEEARGLALGTGATLPDIGARQAAWEAARQDDPPIFLRGDRSADRELAGARLVGLGVSPGRARGPVRVLRTLADGASLRDGEILVAHALDPGWTALLPRAAGLVLELGSVLSHGAVVAREYGVPGVVNLHGATRRLADGQEITVDGGRGVVWIH